MPAPHRSVATTAEASTEQALIGIVMPCYNCGAYLRESLDSVRAQSWTRWECVVVDDGSTDDTAAVADELAALDGRIRVVRQRNAGTPAARNAGIARLSDGAEFVAFLDGDDRWVPDALAELAAAMAGCSAAVGAYGLAEYMDSDGRPLRVGDHPAGQRDRRQMGRFDLVAVPTHEPYTYEAMIVSGTIWPSAVALHRREVIDRVGGFDPQLRQVQDWDLYLRMSREGPFVPVDRQVAWYRQHGENVTRRTDRVAFYSLWVRWKAARAPQNTPRQLRENRRVARRLAGRWIYRSLRSPMRSSRGTRWTSSKRAAASISVFAPQLLAGRPIAPTPRNARLVAEIVVPAEPSEASRHTSS